MAVKGRKNLQDNGAGHTDAPGTKEVFCWPVRFGAMSPRKTGSRLAFSIPEGDKPGCVSVRTARILFAGARLRVKISIDASANVESAYTPGLFEGETAEKVIEATADAKSFSCNPTISSGLTFNNEEVDESDVLPFHDQTGYLQVERLGDVPAKKRGRKPADENQQEFGDDE